MLRTNKIVNIINFTLKKWSNTFKTDVSLFNDDGKEINDFCCRP